MRIRDPGWKNFGSGIRYKLPGYATLAPRVRLNYLIILSGSVRQISFWTDAKIRPSKIVLLFDFFKST
jgi:hypothetical protein